MARFLLIGTLQGVPRARHGAVLADILPPCPDPDAQLAVWGGKHLAQAAAAVWGGVVVSAQEFVAGTTAVDDPSDLLDLLGADGLITLRTPDLRVAMARRVAAAAIGAGAPEVSAWLVHGEAPPTRE